MYGAYDFGCVESADFAGLGDTSSDCAEALAQAKAVRGDWSPDSSFGLTCADPTLSAAQSKACICAGKSSIMLPALLTKATTWVSSQIHPSGGGSTTPPKTGSTPPAGDSSDDSGSALPALLAAGLVGYLLFAK